jgi:hypothetical protein
MKTRFTVVAEAADLALLRRLGHGNASAGFRKLMTAAREAHQIDLPTPVDLLREALYQLEQQEAQP